MKDGFEDERILSRMNGRQAISFLINKKEAADAIRSVEAVKELVREESKTLPEGVEIDYSNDYSRLVRNRFNIVLNNMVIGLALVVILLSVFLNLRSSVWVAVGIPVALLGAL